MIDYEIELDDSLYRVMDCDGDYPLGSPPEGFIKVAHEKFYSDDGTYEELFISPDAFTSLNLAYDWFIHLHCQTTVLGSRWIEHFRPVVKITGSPETITMIKLSL